MSSPTRDSLWGTIALCRRCLEDREGQRFLLVLVGLGVLFLVPLWRWVGYAWATDDASHTLLVPFICLHLIGMARAEPATAPRRWMPGVWGWGIGGAICVTAGLVTAPVPLSANNAALAWKITGFVCLVLAGASWCYGFEAFRRHLFAALFLFTMVPPPTAWVHAFSLWLQLWSADAAEVFFRLTGTTMFRLGQTLQLPGITLEVAEECSGVRSTLVLLVTALIAGKLFFARQWSRIALFLVVIPIGILRNGFRILTVGLLCVHVDPSMVHHWIHHRGGPIFFVLSLIPLFLIAKGLQRLEGKGRGDGREERGERR